MCSICAGSSWGAQSRRECYVHFIMQPDLRGSTGCTSSSSALFQLLFSNGACLLRILIIPVLRGTMKYWTVINYMKGMLNNRKIFKFLMSIIQKIHTNISPTSFSSCLNVVQWLDHNKICSLLFHSIEHLITPYPSLIR